MTVRQRISRFFVSSWFVAIIPSLAVSFFLPGVEEPYKLEAIPELRTPDEVVYADLNNDNKSERIVSGINSPYNRVIVQSNEQQNHEQWNLSDNYTPGISHLNIGDHDHDNLSEIYLFTVNADSVFININEFFQKDGTHVLRRFITKLNLVNGQVASNVLKVCGFYDVNGDASDEIYFSITSGFGLEPRLIYRYDIRNNKLVSSLFTGVNINDPVLTDIDGDKRPEVFGRMTASGNYHSPTPFTDYSTWLMVFDADLRFRFNPREIPGFGNVLEIKAYNHSSQPALLAVHTTGGADTTILAPRLMKYSPDGVLIRERPLSDLTTRKHANIVVPNTPGIAQVVILSDPMYVLDHDLAVKYEAPKPFASPDFYAAVDIDGNGPEELLFYSNAEEKLVAYNLQLKKMATITIKLPDHEWAFSQFKSGHEKKLFLKVQDISYFLVMKSNPHYVTSYLIYPAVYLAFVGFILLIQKVNTRQVARREELRRKLLTLQLQSIKGQLDPHFTFNALNSVASMLYLNDRENAYDYLNKFTRLLRQMFNDADQIFRTLQEEVDFVSEYLSLEKLRFGEKFDYEIKIGQGVTGKERVPKMVIQIFAENAVKHGIMPMAEGGFLKIIVEKVDNRLRLIIEDNGVGRARAAELNPKGKGLEITKEFYELLNQIHHDSIHYVLTDLSDHSKSSGTSVEVWISPVST